MNLHTLRKHKLIPLFFGGGGGDAPDNSGQNEAARVNAEIAKEMWGEYQKTYLPMERQFAADANSFDTPMAREKAAADAAASVTGAMDRRRNASERDLMAMGVNPNSGKFAGLSHDYVGEAAQVAGAENTARENVKNMGYARKQDAISIGKGMPGTAAASMAQAGNAYGQIADQKMQNDQNQAAGLGNMVGGAAAGYGMWNNLKDGGIVEQKLAGGGMAGNPRMNQVMVSPNVMPVGGGGNNAVKAGLNAVQTYRNVKSMANMGKSLGKSFGDPTTTLGEAKQYVFGSPAEASGLQASGAETFPLASTEPITGTALADTTGAAVTDAAATAAAEAAATEAAAGTAAAAGEAAALASNPIGWAIGAGLLASQLFKDGGKVERKDLRKGGKVKGPGTETSDSIPAHLSNGEYVLNAETVKMVGKNALDKINQAGLNQRYGLADLRRGA